ncbi:7627_t:CDS:2 [Funneliformis geosporum]|uniref:16871_t:CDS:1 n=1 Tax=Funneliformis geosporum TaxID=1117311 RepID=A0A9W4SAK1_9GLOM|nr:16871_t:CDS:2 [Funneliformis geosporum]CAI2161687.1 7627_t:CDS:2 [Funneliformis geosporum]
MEIQPQVHQQSSTHMMKTTRSGRPFVKDIHDLFATLVVSLPMEAHRILFRSHPNSFTTEEAIANLGSLKFTQSHRTPDLKDPTKIITTTTTTTFSMTKDMAKSVCQTFMDARLFENLGDSGSRSFKDKSVYGLTLKGLHVLDKFVDRNGIAAPHLAKLFASQASPINLYYIERSLENDSILFSRGCIESLFRRFTGAKPNIMNKDEEKGITSDHSFVEKLDRNLGIELKDRQGRYYFHGSSACDWLCDFTTLITKEESMRIANEFIRFGLIEPLSDKSIEAKKPSNKNGRTFRYSKSTCYQITESGQRIISWNYDGYIPSYTNKSKDRLSNHSVKNLKNINVSQNELPNNGKRSSEITAQSPTIKDINNHYSSKESNAKKLQQILEDPSLRSLFMEFLKANFCEENLLFLLEVQTFKSKYNTKFNESAKMRNHQEQQNLIDDAFRIYHKFLAPGSPHELNIDHGLRQNMVKYMTNIISPDDSAANPITDLLYDKIQDTIFRLMATDSVPKFSKTDKYLSQIRKFDEQSTEENIQKRKHTSSSSTSSFRI